MCHGMNFIRVQKRGELYLPDLGLALGGGWARQCVMQTRHSGPWPEHSTEQAADVLEEHIDLSNSGGNFICIHMQICFDILYINICNCLTFLLYLSFRYSLTQFLFGFNYLRWFFLPCRNVCFLCDLTYHYFLFWLQLFPTLRLWKEKKNLCFLLVLLGFHFSKFKYFCFILILFWCRDMSYGINLIFFPMATQLSWNQRTLWW